MLLEGYRLTWICKTAEYKSRWAAVNLPLAGKVRLISAVKHLNDMACVLGT